MDTIITVMAIMNFLTILGFIMIERRIIKKVESLETLNQLQKKFIDQQIEDNKDVVIFSLKCIIKESLDKEDYETALRCKELIEKYEPQE